LGRSKKESWDTGLEKMEKKRMSSGTTIHVTRWGTEGPVVVMVHGGVQGRRIGGDEHFAKQRELVSRGWQLIVPDRPGHGQSAAPGRPDDVVLDADWVANLLGEGAHLVGHSFGGSVALFATAQRPKAIRSLTLIEPALLSLAIKCSGFPQKAGRIILIR
jgi:pimeloyl-ACP methyl ester carboxylesterase